MGYKESLFHIEWGDGDNSFVIAPDIKTARERFSEGQGFINSIVDLSAIYNLIFKAGQRDVVDNIQREGCTAYVFEGTYTYDTKRDNVIILDLGDFRAKLKEIE